MDYKQAVLDKEKELSELYSRMDTDKNLLYGAYTLEDTEGNPIPHSISIPLRDMLAFTTIVEAALGRSSEHIIVDSEDKKLDTAYIEDAVKSIFNTADRNLSKQGRFPFDSFIDQQTCRRGRAAAKCICQMKDGIFKVKITPWDTRFVSFEMGEEGLEWAAYRTTRTRARILAEYPSITLPENMKEAEVLDIWSKEHTEVSIGGKKVIEEENKFKFVPVCIEIVPIGSMLVDADIFKYQGESLFFLIRDLVPELARLVSLAQSLNAKAFDSALVLPVKDTMGKPPKYDEITTPGSVTLVEQPPVQVPYGRLQQDALLFHNIIETRLQRWALSNFDMGTFTQPMSAVALVTIGQGRDQVYMPRLGTRGRLKENLAPMAIDEIILSGERTVEIGSERHKRKIDVSKLEGEYEITCKYFVKSPEVDIARYSAAVSAGNLISERTKRREIIQLEDPDEEERLLRYEQAEELSASVRMRRTIDSLLEMADEGDEDARFDAELLATEMGVTVEQLMQGNIPEVKPKQPAKPQMPLFPQETSARKAANLQATPRMTEGGE